MRVLGHEVWGENHGTRVVTKSLGVPIGFALGCAVGGAVLGVGAAGVAVVAGGVVTLSPVLGGLYIYRHPPRWMRKYIQPNQDMVNTTAGGLLVRGVKVMVPWTFDDPHYQATLRATNGEVFMGYKGRRDDSVFIAYVDDHNVANAAGTSFLMYFVPIGATQGDVFVQRDPNESMLQVAFPSNRVPEEHPDADVSEMLYRNIERGIIEYTARAWANASD